MKGYRPGSSCRASRSRSIRRSAHQWVRTATEEEDNLSIRKSPNPQFQLTKTSWKRQDDSIDCKLDDIAVFQPSKSSVGPMSHAGEDLQTRSTQTIPIIATTSTKNNNLKTAQIPLRKIGIHKLVQGNDPSRLNTQYKSHVLPNQEAVVKERILRRKTRQMVTLVDHIATSNTVKQDSTLTFLSGPLSLAAQPMVKVLETMKRRGPNKLVTKLQHSDDQQSLRSQFLKQKGPVAKRVKLNPTCYDGSLDTSDKLTDFAYRHTVTAASKTSISMGLVRVHHDAETTPICPTFMRGILCTKANCMKRHDVPLSAATPVCSFFQHQGQCNKGIDCPFRHIKVNPQAMTCPSFSLLGFCEDEKCKMKHFRQDKKGVCKEC